MIGDRYLTDVVYGNRNGLLTVRPAPLTLEGEPSAVLFVSQVWTPEVSNAWYPNRPHKLRCTGGQGTCPSSLDVTELLMLVHQLCGCIQARRVEDHYMRKWIKHGIQVSHNHL